MPRYVCTLCGPNSTRMGAEPPAVCPECGRAEFIQEIRKPLTQYIPDYWRAHLEEKISRIHELQRDAGWDSASFALITDVHVCDNAWHSGAIMEEVLRRCAIPYFYNAGDTISGAGHCLPEDLFLDIDEFRAAFAPVESRCLMVEGNHDTAYSTLGGTRYYAQSLTQAEFNEHFFRCETLYPGRTFGSDGSWYYADDVQHRMRYVILNCHDVPSQEVDAQGVPAYSKFHMCAVRQEQLDWFANVALDVPGQDWTVTLCTHEVPIAECEMYSGDMILGIINAFRNHTAFAGKTDLPEAEYNTEINVDYTGRGGNFTLWVGGHTHKDIWGQLEGINCMCCLNDSKHKSAGSPYLRVEGTTTEHAFDVFTVNKKQRKIYITRIGAGEDRVLEY
ncbi:MAG: metallophosphoesterase [Clostridia bacterium]|nr:metallophosphoesterase [Clostridia bacterium]